MKAIILLAFMLSTLVASATEQTVSVQLSDDDSPFHVYTPELKIDTNKLGRAWVEVEISYEDLEDMYFETVKVKVPGLSHNMETGEIFLNGVSCANVEQRLRRRLFRSPVYKTKIIETGACNFNAEAVAKELTVDTGFDLRTFTKYFLELKYSL